MPTTEETVDVAPSEHDKTIADEVANGALVPATTVHIHDHDAVDLDKMLDGTGSTAPPFKSKSENSIPFRDDEEEKDVGKNAKRNRRKFAVNQRGFMGTSQMETAKLVDEYQLLQVLGQGFYGKVYLASNVNANTGEMLAVKQLDERKFQPEQFDIISTEFSALHRIINRNIVAYKQIILDDNFIYIVTEFVDNGSIFDLMQKNGPIHEPMIAYFTKQIIAALAHLQDLKIVHRNLKCSNVLLMKNNECKITDFELSHKHESNRFTIRGAPYWMAPEVIEMTATPTCACDIWALGCIIVEMLTGEPPYRKLGPMAALLSISRDEHPPIPASISPELKDFLMHCFAKDPTRRSSAKMLKGHPFLQEAASPSTTPTAAAHAISFPASPSSPSASSRSYTHANSPPSSPTSTTSSSHNNPPPAPALLSASTGTLPPLSITLPHASTSPPTTITSPLTPITPPSFPSSPTSMRQSSVPSLGQNIVIDVYTEQDKEDFDLLEMAAGPDKHETATSIDEDYQFKTAASFVAPNSAASELDALKAEIAHLRALNEENVATGHKLRDRYKKNVNVQSHLMGLAWRLRARTDTAVANMRQAAKATAHSSMLLKRTNQVATEALGHGAIVTCNIRKLEEYVLEGDPVGKRLMNLVFKKQTVTPDILVNPTISGYVWYNGNLKSWKKDKERRAWFVLKDNFLFTFKNDKGVALEGVYLGDGARLIPMSEEQCKKKFCFRVADFFLMATDTAELCSEWMLALSKPQKWFESSYEDIVAVSPRAARKGEENGDSASSPPPSLHVNNKGSKGRSGSASALPNQLANVFGMPIEDLFAREGGNVPYFFMRIIQFLEEKGLQEEGILRVSGSVSEINALKEALQHGEDVDYSEHDPHAVAGLMKVFFRELPAPIIPEPYHSRILEVMFNQEVQDDQRVVEVKIVLDQLPAPNWAVLKCLMNFLVKVNCNADKNKMTIQNLITCMVPTIRCVPGVFMYVIPNFDFVFDID